MNTKAMVSDLYEVAAYFESRADVKDGDYGQPEPNEEMTLLDLLAGVIRRLEETP